VQNLEIHADAPSCASPLSVSTSSTIISLHISPVFTAMLHDVQHAWHLRRRTTSSPDLRPRVPECVRSLQGHMHTAGKLRPLQPGTRLSAKLMNCCSITPAKENGSGWAHRRTGCGYPGGSPGRRSRTGAACGPSTSGRTARTCAHAESAGQPQHDNWHTQLPLIAQQLAKQVSSWQSVRVLACKSWAALHATKRKWEHDRQHRSAHPWVHTTGSSSPEGKGPRHWEPLRVLLVPSPAAPLVWNSQLHWSARG
jgi:hypothetical protein